MTRQWRSQHSGKLSIHCMTLMVLIVGFFLCAANQLVGAQTHSGPGGNAVQVEDFEAPGLPPYPVETKIPADQSYVTDAPQGQRALQIRVGSFDTDEHAFAFHLPVAPSPQLASARDLTFWAKGDEHTNHLEVAVMDSDHTGYGTNIDLDEQWKYYRLRLDQLHPLWATPPKLFHFPAELLLSLPVRLKLFTSFPLFTSQKSHRGHL